MWDQPTEPTLVGAPVGHPDGSFGLASSSASTGGAGGLWGGGGNGAQPSTMGGGSGLAPGGAQRPSSGWGAPLTKSSTGAPPPTVASWAASAPGMAKNGPTTNGWGDQQQQQPSSNPVIGANGGWGTPQQTQHPTAVGATTWNGAPAGGPPHPQWENANAGASHNSSWSQIASKNVQSTGRTKSGNFEAPGGTPANWGNQPVDQGTPWGGNSEAKGKDWQSNAGHVAGPTWSDAMMPPSKDPDVTGGGMPSWQMPPGKEKPLALNDGGAAVSTGAYWKSSAAVHGGGGATAMPVVGPMQAAQRTASTSGGGQWGAPADHHVTSGSGWDSLPPQANRSWNHSEPSTPSNMWTGPPTDSCVDSSMVWNNPNPKKVAQPDKGTNFWGDPTGQQEIRRWKPSDVDENVVAVAAAGPPSAAQPTALPSAQAATAAFGGVGGGSVWKETPMAPKSSAVPTPTSNVSGGGWAAAAVDQGPPSAALAAAPKSSSADVGGTAIWETSSAKNTPTPAPANLSGWPPAPTNNTTPVDLWQTAPNKLENETSDDVFCSNSGTPMNQKNGLNANYQRMPQGPPQVQQGGKTLQSMQTMANSQQMEMLTSKISDQLKAACAAGLIDKNVLYSRLPQETLVRLYYLLQYLPKLEQAQREIQSIRAAQGGQSLNEAQSQEMRRLTNEVHQYQTAIQSLRAQIDAQLATLDKTSQSGGPQPGSLMARPASSLNTMTKDPSSSPPGPLSDSFNQSKLLQWKNANGVPLSAVNEPSLGEKSKCLAVTSPSSTNLESLVQSMANASVVIGGGVDDLWASSTPIGGESALKRDGPTSSSWPKIVGEFNRNEENRKAQTGATDSQINESVKDASNLGNTPQNSTFTTSSSSEDSQRSSQARDSVDFFTGLKSADEGPPEFRPGQKWLWKDPKEMADDPNATPGSIKPNSLTLNTNLNFLSFGANNAFSMQSPFMQSHQQPAHQHQHQQAQFLMGPHQQQQQHGMGPMGQQQQQQPQNSMMHHHHSFGGTPSSLFGPNKMMDDFKAKQNMDFFGAPRLNSAAAGPMGRVPLSMGQLGANSAPVQAPFAARPPLIKPQFSMPNAFVPYANVGQQQQWIVLTITNLSQIDEHTLQILVNSHGTTQTYISPPGSGLAFVKFRDVPLDRVLSKMQQEFTPLGVTIQLTKDSEVERLLQAFNNSGRPGPAGPRHPSMWDAPPPPVGPWAGPPPPPLHHHGPHPHFSAPPPPPPGGPMGGMQQADTMAQLMQQPPMMQHDPLLGPPDRHAF